MKMKIGIMFLICTLPLVACAVDNQVNIKENYDKTVQNKSTVSGSSTKPNNLEWERRYR